MNLQREILDKRFREITRVANHVSNFDGLVCGLEVLEDHLVVV